MVVFSQLGAQGHSIPAFAVVLLPGCASRPALADIHLHEHGEQGPEFYARVIQAAKAGAMARSVPVEAVQVLFTNALPPPQWRDRWHRLELLRWRLTRPYIDADTAIADATELAKMAGLLPAQGEQLA